MASTEDGVAVQLEPFPHQVGGHDSILRFDDKTVCKPLSSREHHFYQTMPSELKCFTPKYRGVVEVSFHEDSDGYMRLVAHPSVASISRKAEKRLTPSSSPSSGGEAAQSDSDTETEEPAHKSKERYHVRRTGSTEKDPSRMKKKGINSKGLELEERGGRSSPVPPPTPWSLHCHRAQLAKMRGTSQHKMQKFLLLEDLASQFEMPCVLDLKMGTRQHGDDASEEKIQGHQRKCANTTSGTLGLRICGMQVYQADSNRYIRHDKYHGRRLSEAGVRNELEQFLHNGLNLRTDLLDIVIEKLERLQAVLTDQNTFRFYSSSLLISYDGARCADHTSPAVSAGEVDHTVNASDVTMHEDERITQYNIAASCSSCLADKIVSESSTQKLVDVRMIDFAHVTHQGFQGDRKIHKGPDHGYLRGLQTLLQLFQDLKLTQDTETAS